MQTTIPNVLEYEEHEHQTSLQEIFEGIVGLCTMASWPLLCLLCARNVWQIFLQEISAWW